MLTLVTKKNEIRKLRSRLIRSLGNVPDKQVRKVKVGWQGGNYDARLSFSTELGMWWYHDVESNRYWNIFGLGTPEEYPYSNSITCEINFPIQGVNLRIAGAFAKDENGKAFIVHSGKIGGGKTGVGKERFWNEFRGRIVSVRYRNWAWNFGLIGALDGSRLPRQIVAFVQDVGRIKKLTGRKNLTVDRQDSEVERLNVKPTFVEEFSGQKEYEHPSNVKAESDHGIIVNRMASILQSAGLNVGNRHGMDLYVLDQNDRIKSLFEVKTDSDAYSCYEAIGQLLFKSSMLLSKPRLVAVFPDTMNRTRVMIFEKLGIDCVLYKWKDESEPLFNKDLRDYK